MLLARRSRVRKVGWSVPDRGVLSLLVVVPEPLVKDGSQCWQGRSFRDPGADISIRPTPEGTRSRDSLSVEQSGAG
jgi:hypothetical protein